MDWKNKIPLAGAVLAMPIVAVVKILNDSGLIVVGGGVALIAGAGVVIYLRVREKGGKE